MEGILVGSGINMNQGQAVVPAISDEMKIKILETENAHLEAINENLQAENGRRREQEKQVQAALERVQVLTATLEDTKQRYEEAIAELKAFGAAYRSATENAMAQTLKPYQKALKQAKRDAKPSWLNQRFHRT